MLDKASRRGLGGAVFVVGHRHDIPEILAGSDLVVDASYAGLGLTGSLREALAVETPVIGTNLEGMIIAGMSQRLRLKSTLPCSIFRSRFET